MSNAFMNMARTTTCATLARRVLQTARLATNSTAYSFLGSSDEDAQQGLVDILNAASREILNDFPSLMVVETTLSTTANQRHVLLPSTLRHTDIMGVYWGDDEDEGYAGQPIDEKSLSAIDQLHVLMRDPNYTAEYPEFYALSPIQIGGQAAINLYPVPDGVKTIRILYRANDTPFTTVDLGSTEATATAVLTSGAVTSATITEGGTGYASAPTITFSGGGGTGATATATVTAGVVTAIAISAGGSGYASAPTMSFSGGRTISTVPDDMLEIHDFAAAYRLQQRNTGTPGMDWQGLKALYTEKRDEYAYRLPVTTNALRHMHFGRDGEMRDLASPFGAASFDLEEYDL